MIWFSVSLTLTNSNPSFYNIGFEFVSVSEEERKIIEDMIVAYEFRRQSPNNLPNPSIL